MSNIDKIYKYLISMFIFLSFSAMAEQDADAFFQAGDWAKAADAYVLRTAEDPGDATAWFRLAVSARQAERYSVALNALAKAEGLEPSRVRIGFERARHVPDGRVRQFFERWSDDAETWSPWFEGFYTRKPAEQVGLRKLI